MRIALVGPAHPFKGGGAAHTTELAHRLAGRGHDVTIESWSRQYPRMLYPGQPTVDSPEVRLFEPTRRELSWRRPDGWVRVGRRLARTADAVVLCVLSPVQVPAYLAIRYGLAGSRGTRTVALCHNVLPHEPRFFDTALMRALLRRTDGVLVHSERQAQLAGSLAPVAARAVTMPPHLPEDAQRGPVSGAGTASDAAAGARWSPRRRLLFFGIVRPYKGLDVLLRALAQGPPDVSLTVAGEFWGGTAQTEALIAELGLTGRVELRPGYVPADQVPELFAAADALVLPYRAATASQNVWMGHDHGVPVIATRAGALADHVRDGVDGLLCDPEDVAGLADTLHRFYEPGEPARLRAGVEAVDPEPYWTSYVDELVDLAGS